MLRKFKDFFRNIDIYGQSVTFSFRSDDEYKTSFGGIMSVTILAIVISFFYSNIMEFFQMTSITATNQIYFQSHPNTLNLTNQDFMFAVQIEQSNFTTNPYFNISVEQRLYKRFTNGTQIKKNPIYFDLVPCQLQHFQPVFTKYNVDFQEEFEKQSLSNFLCPNLNKENNSNYLVGGQWSSEDYYFLKFSVTTCNQEKNNDFSWKPNCKTKLEIEEFLQKEGAFRFKLFTTNYVMKLYLTILSSGLILFFYTQYNVC